MKLNRALSLAALPFLMIACAPGDNGDAEKVGNELDGLKVCPKATVEGIDVSEWQGNIDWKAVHASGREFAVIRVADGSYIDKKFAQNWSGAKAAGMVRGAYQFFRASEDGTTQANILLQHLGGDIGELAPVADVEVTDGVGPGKRNSHLAQ